MDDANLFGSIDLLGLIPLIAIGVVERAAKQSNTRIPVVYAKIEILGANLRPGYEH